MKPRRLDARASDTGTPDRQLLRVSGYIDLSNVNQIAGAVRSAASNACNGITLDLSGVTYCDSLGVSMLFRLFREFADRNQELSLVVPPGSVIRRVLILGGVLAAIPTQAAPPPVPIEDAGPSLASGADLSARVLLSTGGMS